MTLQETEAMNKWIDQKQNDRNVRLFIENWKDKETDQDRVGFSYWFWKGEKEYRIFQIGTNTEEVYQACLQMETKLTQAK